MHSSELPITEWWDPEWDVYDVLGSPYDDFWQQPVTSEAADHWWRAYEHQWNIRWVMHGSAEYRPDFRGRELTQHAYPGQPATRTRPPTKPCTCRYHRMRWVLPIPFIETENHTVIDVLSVRGFSWFTINPDCPHHGRQVLILNPALPAELTIEALWNDPALNVMRDPYDLDDDERRD